MSLSTEPTFGELVNAVCHIAENPDAFLELAINGVVLRIYPGRVVAPTEKERMKRFASFVLALVRMTESESLQFSLRAHSEWEIGEAVLEIGVDSSPVQTFDQIWMPCEVARVQFPPGPMTFSLPSLDGAGESTEMRMVPIRKILL